MMAFHFFLYPCTSHNQGWRRCDIFQHQGCAQKIPKALVFEQDWDLVYSGHVSGGNYLLGLDLAA